MTDSIYEPVIQGAIEAEEIEIGRGVVVEPGVVISAKNGPARKVVLGDFCFIGRDTKILVPEFCLGDYSKLHAFSFAQGERALQIGRNCWIGGNTVLDSMGGLDIEDNVGVGAHSQLWTHIQFGDIVEGCRFHSKKYMLIGRDAWFVGHCIVHPVRVGEKAMALAGSVIETDMRPNHVYAGVPARDVTARVGHQFRKRSLRRKVHKLQSLIDEFTARHPEYRGRLAVITSPEEACRGICNFDVSRRTYTQTYSPAEVSFLKEYTPLIKFTPEGKGSFIRPQSSAPAKGSSDGKRGEEPDDDA